LDCRHVCKTCAFHDALQAGKQKEVDPKYSPDLAPAGARSGEYGTYTGLRDITGQQTAGFTVTTPRTSNVTDPYQYRPTDNLVNSCHHRSVAELQRDKLCGKNREKGNSL
jgi:hypothetical protein